MAVEGGECSTNLQAPVAGARDPGGGRAAGRDKSSRRRRDSRRSVGGQRSSCSSTAAARIHEHTNARIQSWGRKNIWRGYTPGPPLEQSPLRSRSRRKASRRRRLALPTSAATCERERASELGNSSPTSRLGEP